jgi:hypothetical protein
MLYYLTICSLYEHMFLGGRIAHSYYFVKLALA